MSITFYGEEDVTIKQLVEAGERCGIVVTETEEDSDLYKMTWDIDDYETYARKLGCEEAFRECIQPINGRFVMVRHFYLFDGCHFNYSVYGLSGKCSDDCGIAHRLMDEAGVGLLGEEEMMERSALN